MEVRLAPSVFRARIMKTKLASFDYQLPIDATSLRRCFARMTVRMWLAGVVGWMTFAAGVYADPMSFETFYKFKSGLGSSSPLAQQFSTFPKAQ
jgi:hypothetical protein